MGRRGPAVVRTPAMLQASQGNLTQISEDRAQTGTHRQQWIHGLPSALEVAGLASPIARDVEGTYALMMKTDADVAYENKAGNCVLLYEAGAWTFRDSYDSAFAILLAEGEESNPAELATSCWFMSNGESWVAVPANFTIQAAHSGRVQHKSHSPVPRSPKRHMRIPDFRNKPRTDQTALAVHSASGDRDRHSRLIGKKRVSRRSAQGGNHTKVASRLITPAMLQASQEYITQRSKRDDSIGAYSSSRPPRNFDISYQPHVQQFDISHVSGPPEQHRTAGVHGAKMRQSRRSRTVFKEVPLGVHNSDSHEDSFENGISSVRSTKVRSRWDKGVGNVDHQRHNSPLASSGDLELKTKQLLGDIAKRWAEAADWNIPDDINHGSDKTWIERWDNAAETSRDVQGESLVSQLGEVLRSQGDWFKFEDADFGPCANGSALCPGGAQVANEWLYSLGINGGLRDVEWKRAPQMYGGDGSQVICAFSGDIDPEDVDQREESTANADNGYFLAAVSAIAGQGSGAGAAEDVLTKDLLVEDGADVGLFGVKLWIGGRWRTMVLDDRFPCIKNQDCDQWEPLFAKRVPGREFELWPLLFEKAWAKLHGSWAATAGGWAVDALNYLTGGACSVIDVYDEEAADRGDEQPSHQKEWEQLLAVVGGQQGDWPPFLTAALTVDSADKYGSAGLKGLLPGHTYSVVFAAQIKDTKLVCLRGAEGAAWGGKFCAGSSDLKSLRPALLAQGVRRELLPPDGVDISLSQVSWMSFADFKARFWEVGVCDPWLTKNAHGPLSHSHTVLEVYASRGYWRQGHSAGGRDQAPTFHLNPSWKLRVDAAQVGPVTVTITMYQQDIRGQNDQTSDFQPMSLWCESSSSKSTPRQLLQLDVNRRQMTCSIPVTPQTQYILRAATWAPAVEGCCTVTVCGHGVRFETLSPSQSPTDVEKRLMTAEWLANSPHCRVLSCVVSQQAIGDKPYVLFARGPVLEAFIEEYLRKHPEEGNEL